MILEQKTICQTKKKVLQPLTFHVFRKNEVFQIKIKTNQQKIKNVSNKINQKLKTNY